MHYQMANLEAAKFGPDAQALLLDEDGFVCEGSGANFIMVKDGKLIVPEPRNMLRGSSMEYILGKVAPQLKLRVIHRNIEVYDVMQADEAMFTGTFVNLLPINRLNGVPLNEERKITPMGPVTKSILTQWGKNVGVDLYSQLVFWGLK
jgi:branched-chain amino acid aminotransferase